MTNSNLGKQGMPVLACLTSEPLSLSCSMRIFYNQARKQFTLALRTSLLLHGAVGEQTFIAQYDADNLLPNTTALDSTTIHVRGEHRTAIARNADPLISTLSLSVRQPSPLWCPRLEALAPQAESKSVASFNELVELAKATTVHVVFDHKWLHKDTQTALQRLVKGKERLTGYPLDKHYAKSLRQKDWTIFGPTCAGFVPPTAAEPSNKRPRQGSVSASPSPPPKRKVLGKAQSPGQAASPTDCASSPPAYADEEDEQDFQSQAIGRAVKRHLPAILKRVLPEILPEILPTLPTLLTLPSTFTSFDSSRTSQVPELTPIGASFVPHILAHIQPQLLKLHTQALSSAFHRQEEAALEFEEDFEFHKAELMQIRDDGIDDLQREATDALHLAKEKGTDWAEELAEQVEDAVRTKLGSVSAGTLRQAKLDRLAAQKLWSEENLRRRGDVHRLNCARISWTRQRGKGGYRGLGDRWRKASRSS
ncbi:hypothetical protein SVAN01_09030 [Stagonosporopsis vannaccii]|nr:hypothetical protein SVAN01_09030 [Stagonosporopsis vannaccii]